MKTLTAIAEEHKTDKVEPKHNYIQYYEKHFEPIRNESLNILEIGVKRKTPKTPGASSLRTWKDFFPNSQVFGIDIDPKNKDYEQDRIKIFIGNQADEDFLNQTTKETGKLDIIIDDASHVNHLTLESWTHLFPHLKSGGMYIIEDMCPTYQNLDNFDVRRKASKNEGWWGMHLLPEDISYNNDRSLMTDFFKERLFRMDIGSRSRWKRAYGAGDQDLESLIFFPNICFMVKK